MTILTTNNAHNGNGQQQPDGEHVLNEWGCYEFDSYRDASDKFEMKGVLEGIRNEDPAFTAVLVDISREDYERDWAAIGKCLGQSKFVIHLRVVCYDNVDNLDSLRTFCMGLAHNRSIKSLQINGDEETGFPEEASEVLEYLIPFLANNANRAHWPT
jgi:hypothetical protein